MDQYIVDLSDIREAAGRIAPHVNQTPVATSAGIDRLAGREVFFKCENLQRCGAFKTRGAVNAVLSLSQYDASRGVATHSSGNHGLGLAYAASLRHIDAHIVVPENAPVVKRCAIEQHGGRLYLCPPNFEGRESVLEEVVAKTGAVHIPSSGVPSTVAGQGTVALELLNQVQGLDALVVPVGSGGLIAGMSLAVREMNPRIRLFGAEPGGADDAYQSKIAKQLVQLENPESIAKGLLAPLGARVWPVVRDCVEAIIRVDDNEILHAIRAVWERMRLVVEPSGAVGVAALLSQAFLEMDHIGRVGVVLTGGNLDPAELPQGYSEAFSDSTIYSDTRT